MRPLGTGAVRWVIVDLPSRLIRSFFEEYLPHLRGLSTHTIKSYRDALVLFLRFASSDADCPIERLDIADLDRERAMRFLAYLETGRRNSIATRNARLAALHTFARFLAAERPEHLATLQAILAIPFKRGARDGPIEYFETAEMEALLQSIDCATRAARLCVVRAALQYRGPCPGDPRSKSLCRNYRAVPCKFLAHLTVIPTTLDGDSYGI